MGKGTRAFVAGVAAGAATALLLRWAGVGHDLALVTGYLAGFIVATGIAT